jgi:dTDP-4-amino-4,6-dideoxygalactose transaminase
LDIGDTDLNFDIKNLEKHTDIKVLIIQNTFGCPMDIVSVKSFCKKHNIVIIEDLAHSAGSTYSDGHEVGTTGDFTALSFSQDKIIDAVSGGALIVRNNKFKEKLGKVNFTKLPLANIFRDRVYPLLTFKIRFLYSIGIGKAIHFVAKRLHILSEPMGSLGDIKYYFPTNWHISMALSSLGNLDSQIKHRREIANIYINNLNENILSEGVIKNCNSSTNIRFPIFIEDRNSLIKHLKKNGIFVSDIWYDAPIAPAKLIYKTKYNGECPKAEVDGKLILNLPTHINVTKKEAERISAEVNKWLNTHKK